MGSGGLSTFDSRRTCPWWRKAEKGPSSSGSRAASGPQAALLPQSRAGGGESGAWPGPHGADSGCRSVSRGGARPAGKLESPRPFASAAASGHGAPGAQWACSRCEVRPLSAGPLRHSAKPRPRKSLAACYSQLSAAQALRRSPRRRAFRVLSLLVVT